MDIYLKEKSNSSSRFRFPSLPEVVKINRETNYQTYEILGKGTVKIPKGLEIGTISWEGVFHGEAKKNEFIVREWISPAECKKKLETWQKNGVVLNLIIADVGINLDVTISEFSYTEFGGHGSVKYSINFIQSVELKIYTTNELKITNYVKKLVARSTPNTKKAYTIESGDTLWAIARKFYGGSGIAWTKIYAANKNVIENVAKKHGKSNSSNGHWIYPGTKLEIP